ncbi:MAG: hypothetical protein ACPLW7_06230 [Minisyncoccia bacterium]
MKKCFLILVLFFISSLIGFSAVKLTKIWQYGYGNSRGWVYMWEDEWGGDNYWCTGPGNECGQWDWKAEYWVTMSGENPTPPFSNTPEYGDNLVRETAKRQNILLPPDLGMPEFKTIWEPAGN